MVPSNLTSSVTGLPQTLEEVIPPDVTPDQARIYRESGIGAYLLARFKAIEPLITAERAKNERQLRHLETTAPEEAEHFRQYLLSLYEKAREKLESMPIVHPYCNQVSLNAFAYMYCQR